MGSLRWAIALLFAWVTGGRAELVAAAVLPHGDFAFDPRLLSDPDAREKAERGFAELLWRLQGAISDEARALGHVPLDGGREDLSQLPTVGVGVLLRQPAGGKEQGCC